MIYILYLTGLWSSFRSKFGWVKSRYQAEMPSFITESDSKKLEVPDSRNIEVSKVGQHSRKIKMSRVGQQKNIDVGSRTIKK